MHHAPWPGGFCGVYRPCTFSLLGVWRASHAAARAGALEALMLSIRLAPPRPTVDQQPPPCSTVSTRSPLFPHKSLSTLRPASTFQSLSRTHALLHCPLVGLFEPGRP